MTVRRLLILLVACALLAPAAVRAAGPGTGGAAAPPPDPRLATSPNVMLGKPTTFSGVLPLAGGATATVERLDARTGAWLPIASAPIAADGSYAARWTADVAGRITTRVTAGRAGDPGAALGRRTARGRRHDLPPDAHDVVRPGLLRQADLLRRSG